MNITIMIMMLPDYHYDYCSFVLWSSFSHCLFSLHISTLWFALSVCIGLETYFTPNDFSL